MRNCCFSSTLRNHSNPPPAAAVAFPPPPPPVYRLFIVPIAALANDPPVPLIAEIARLAVSSTASVTVALPEMKDVRVSEAERAWLA